MREITIPHLLYEFVGLFIFELTALCPLVAVQFVKKVTTSLFALDPKSFN